MTAIEGGRSRVWLPRAMARPSVAPMKPATSARGNAIRMQTAPSQPARNVVPATVRNMTSTTPFVWALVACCRRLKRNAVSAPMTNGAPKKSAVPYVLKTNTATTIIAMPTTAPAVALTRAADSRDPSAHSGSAPGASAADGAKQSDTIST